MRIFYIWLLISLCYIVACENTLDQSANVLPQKEMTAGNEDVDDIEEDGGDISCGETIAGSGAMAGMAGGAMTGGAMTGGAMAGNGMTGGEATSSNESCGPCPDCPTIGTWYRFTELEIKSLDGDSEHPVINLLNTLWKGDIERNQLNILFEIIDKNETEVTMRALNAAFLSEEENDFCLLPDTAINFVFQRDQINGCAFSNPEASGINIYAGTTEIPKNCALDADVLNTIPIRNTLMEGQFSRSCEQIKIGNVLSASMPKSALGGICSCLSPQVDSCRGLDPSYPGNANGECAGCGPSYLMSLKSQLENFRPLKYECEADGGPAVCLSAGFSADRLSMTPPVCQ